MRKKIVAGNWKMNLNAEEASNLVNGVCTALENIKLDESIHIVFGPPAPYLPLVKSMIPSILTETALVAAQNCHSEPKGAYTGEVAASMLSDIACDYVILGHSERRKYFKEDNELLNKKVQQALANDLEVIFCCGESLEQRNAGVLFDVVKDQLTAIFDLSEEDFKKVVIAYEPVWAIGTGVTASPEQAQEMHAYIRKLIAEQYSEAIAENTTILYGGSVKPANAVELFANADVDGGLVGGASLKDADFVDIIKAIV